MKAQAAFPTRTQGAGAPKLLSLAIGLLFIGVLLLFLVSPMLLDRFGFAYGASGGSVFDKIHPGTLAIFAAFACRALIEGNPLPFLLRIANRHGGVLIFLAAWALLMLQAMLVQRIPFTPLIDTFLMPALLLVLLVDLPEAVRRRLRLALHLIMGANAIIALFEIMSGLRLTPYVIAGVPLVGDWRATALFGHPLANAALTGCYVLMLTSGGGRGLPGPLVFGLFGVNLAAMVAFGGRAALVMLMLVLAVNGGLAMLRFFAGVRLPLRLAAGFAVLVPLGLIGLFGAAEAGFFDRFLQRFVSDEGSASTRLAMFDVFRDIPFRDVLIGPDPELLSTLVRVQGLEFGLESFWVAMVLTYGLVASLVFFFGLFFLCLEAWHAAGRSGLVPLLYFFVVASTSVSISSKTTLLGMLIAQLVLLLNVKAQIAPSPLRRHGQRPHIP